MITLVLLAQAVATPASLWAGPPAQSLEVGEPSPANEAAPGSSLPIGPQADGLVFTLAGDGTQSAAEINGPPLSVPMTDPMGVTAVTLAVGEQTHSVALVSSAAVDRVHGIHPLVAGGGTVARSFPHLIEGEPYDIAFDHETFNAPEGWVYIVTRLGHSVVRLPSAPGTPPPPQLIAGGTQGPASDGPVPGAEATFNQPHDLCLDGRGGLLVADTKNHVIRRIDLDDPTFPVSVWGRQELDGQSLRGPRVIVRDTAATNAGGFVVAYREANRLVQLDADGRVTAVLAGTGTRGNTGDGGPAIEATLGGPKGLAVAEDGDLYFADTENHTVRYVDRQTGRIETLIGDGKKGDGPDGTARECRLSRPHGVALLGSLLLIADTGNHRLRAVDVTIARQLAE